MRVKIIEENGFDIAMLGLSMNKKKDPANMPAVAAKLGKCDGGHNKFLESITVSLDITAPRYWWSEFDTYRVGITKQSESTMHTLEKEHITNDCFEYDIPDFMIEYVNYLIKNKQPIEIIKNALPEGFLQRRIVITNWKTLRNIYLQRKSHRLPQWGIFCKELQLGKYFNYAISKDEI